MIREVTDGPAAAQEVLGTGFQSVNQIKALLAANV
jgi:hypothetical protein